MEAPIRRTGRLIAVRAVQDDQRQVDAPAARHDLSVGPVDRDDATRRAGSSSLLPADEPTDRSWQASEIAPIAVDVACVVDDRRAPRSTVRARARTPRLADSSGVPDDVGSSAPGADEGAGSPRRRQDRRRAPPG